MKLAEREHKLIREILSRYATVKKATLFGSRALDFARPESDIDLVVYGQLEDFELARLAGEFAEASTPYRFDLRRYENIRHAGLRQHIDDYGVLVYEQA